MIQATAWDADAEVELKVNLSILGQLVDYDVNHEWEAECEGHNNPLRTGRGVHPDENVEEFSPEWEKMASIRETWQFIRLDSGLSITEAARQLDVAVSTVKRWESGERTPRAHRPRYLHWLDDKKAHLIDLYRGDIIDLIALRDRWPHAPTGHERQALLDELTRIGGWWDQYRRTGQIPNTRRTL